MPLRVVVGDLGCEELCVDGVSSEDALHSLAENSPDQNVGIQDKARRHH